jgi:hypothetical protein
MIGTTAAIIGAAAIGAGAQIYGANKASSAAKKAANLQTKQFEESKALLAPYTTAGEGALSTYSNAVGLNGREAQQKFSDDFQTDPGWEAANEFGAKTVDDRYRLSGQGGGNVRAALYDYGQKNLLSAYTTRLSQLGGLVDTGRAAASTTASMGQQSAATQGSLLSQAGLLQGQGITGAGNAIAGGMNNLANFNMYSQGMNAGSTPGTLANGGWSTQLSSNNTNRYFN